jgi:hypothetical protein
LCFHCTLWGGYLAAEAGGTLQWHIARHSVTGMAFLSSLDWRVHGRRDITHNRRATGGRTDRWDEQMDGMGWRSGYWGPRLHGVLALLQGDW